MTTISAKDVSALRQKTGAGMMDCKKALAEAGGDEQKAIEILRRKGLKAADKKAERSTSEGRVYAYIHHNQRVGVMIQVACETDFVARGEEFERLCSDLCMQIAATDPLAVSAEDLPADVLESERKALMEADDLQGKPEEVREKIVDGRMRKFVQDRALLEQEFVKDPSMTVSDRVKAAIAKLGENIRVERFCRFELGA